jgi:hypothetical protein
VVYLAWPAATLGISPKHQPHSTAQQSTVAQADSGWPSLSLPQAMKVSVNPTTGRLPANIVQHLERLVGGGPAQEAQVSAYIADQFHAASLFYLPPEVAERIIDNPARFVELVKQYHEPLLTF